MLEVPMVIGSIEHSAEFQFTPFTKEVKTDPSFDYSEGELPSCIFPNMTLRGMVWRFGPVSSIRNSIDFLGVAGFIDIRSAYSASAMARIEGARSVLLIDGSCF